MFIRAWMIGLVSLLLVGGAQVQAQETEMKETMQVKLIPRPRAMQSLDGQLPVGGPVMTRTEGAGLAFAAQQLAEVLAPFEAAREAGQGSVPALLRLDQTLAPEAYRLRIDQQGIEISAGSPQGVLHGVQSLRQIAFQAGREDGEAALPLLQLDDAPRLPYRGMHLDVSRHFFDVAFIKRYIDLLVLHKMNVFHWHLTDDQGWRIEIKAYPKLTGVGSRRSGTVIGHTHDAGARSDGRPYGGYYSQEEIREVVAYAAQRHITIIPEIDVPGHASAMLAAYPELGCSGEPGRVQTHFGIFADVLCPRESTFSFLQAVLTEVAALFPGPYIHIGGDEVRKEQWQACQECSRLMQEQGLEDYTQLQAWFVNRVEAIVHGLGKRIIGWDEILDGEIRSSATVMSWRGMQGGIRGAERGHEVIMTPVQHAYFDFYQSESLDEPMAIHGLTRLQDVYRFQPVPAELDVEQQRRIIGGQGNLWTEYVRDDASAERMVLPRMSALAEVLWTPRQQQSFEDFAHRLPAFESLLRELDYRVADSHYKPHISAVPDAEGGWQVTIDALAETVVYTLDGSDPGADSTPYQGVFAVAGSVTVRAASLWQGQLHGDARLTLEDHLARGAVVAAAGATNDAGADLDGLVDGRIGRDRIFRYPDWAAFDDRGMDVVIDLGEPQAVSTVTIGIDAGLHRTLYKPTSFQVMLADEDGAWRSAGVLDEDAIARAGNSLSLSFPTRRVERLRVIAGNSRMAWSEEDRAQRPVTLRVDEISVR